MTSLRMSAWEAICPVTAYKTTIKSRPVLCVMPQKRNELFQ